MRYAIFSDVHSNLEALNAAVAFYKQQSIDKYIFLGDIVGYGCDPVAAIDMLQKLSPVCLAGNHDWAAIDKVDVGDFNDFAKEAIVWTKSKISDAHRLALGSYALTHTEPGFMCVHATLNEPQKFHYLHDIETAKDNFKLLKEQILFVGHSHVAGAYCLRDGAVMEVYVPKLNILPTSKYIVNVGSVGQPRDGDFRACCCVYDSNENTVIFNRLNYNIDIAARKIFNAGLPERLALRLFTGD